MKHRNVTPLSSPRPRAGKERDKMKSTDTQSIATSQFYGGKMNKLAKILIISAILFVFGLVTTTQFNTPTVLAENNIINVCSHNGTQNYNILGGNATSLRAKLDNEANFGPNGAYGDYDFNYIDVGDNFTKQTILDNACNIWFSGYENDNDYTPQELTELQSWVTENNGQVMAGCDGTNNDPVCALLDFSVTTSNDSYGFLTETATDNPLNCNGALGPNSQLEMSGGEGGYFSGPGVTAQNVLAVHEQDGVANNNQPIVIYTGNYFLTSDINMIQTGTASDPTLSDGPDVTNNNDILAMNAFSALADASVGKQICSSVIPAPPTEVPPTPVPPSEPTCDCSAQANPGSAASAPGLLNGFAPISIYSLDNDSIEDSILDENPNGTKTATGTINGNPTPTEDRFGNANGALLFDGDDYIQTNEDSNINPLTFSVWFRADDVSDEHSIVDSDVSGKYGHSLIIGYEGGANGTGGNDGTLDVQYHNGFWDTGKQIQAGVWYHAFVTYGDEMRLYLGAQGEKLELVAQQPYDTTAGFDGENFRFGRHNSGDPQWFKGAMDDIRFYDKALSLEEINEVTTCVCPPSEPPALPAQPIPHCSWGDVHIRTPDGLAYNFQQVGDFVLTQSTSGDVMVQARQEWHPTNNRVSINKAVALNVAGDKLELYLEPERRFYINGVLTDPPTSFIQLPKGGIISPSGNDFTIVWPDGNTGARVAVVGIKSHMDIGIARLNGALTYEGVCGNLDGNAQNDMQIRGGAELSMPANNDQLKAFGNSWLVAGNESLFSQPISAIETEALIAQSASNVQFVSYSGLPANQADDSEAPLTLLDLDPAEREAAKQTCQNAGVTDQLALNTCTYDVAATNENVFVESAQTFQTAIEALPPAERTSVAAVPSQGLLIDDEAPVAAAEEPATPVEPIEDPETPTKPAEETATTTEPAESDAGGFGSGLCNAPLALPMVLGITFLAANRRKKR